MHFHPYEILLWIFIWMNAHHIPSVIVVLKFSHCTYLTQKIFKNTFYKCKKKCKGLSGSWTMTCRSIPYGRSKKSSGKCNTKTFCDSEWTFSVLQLRQKGDSWVVPGWDLVGAPLEVAVVSAETTIEGESIWWRDYDASFTIKMFTGMLHWFFYVSIY